MLVLFVCVVVCCCRVFVCLVFVCLCCYVLCSGVLLLWFVCFVLFVVCVVCVLLVWCVVVGCVCSVLVDNIPNVQLLVRAIQQRLSGRGMHPISETENPAAALL